MISLGASIADVAIPFVGGVGEAVKCYGVVHKANNVIDTAKQSKKVGSKSVGTYEIMYKSGNK